MRRRDRLPTWPLTEANAERIAHILGEQSAAAKMLAEYRRRKAAGEEVVMFRHGAHLIVGPNPETRHDP